MKLQIDSDLSSFQKHISLYLEKEASLHSFILGLVLRYIELQKPMSLLIRLLDENENLLGCGIQTEPERALILSNVTAMQAKAIANLLAPSIASLPAANGPALAVDSFAQNWASLKNTNSKILTHLRLFELTELTDPRSASGHARAAELKDAPLIFRWMREFHDEAVPHDPRGKDEDVIKNIESGIERGQFFLWEDRGECVSWVGSRRETPRERWIAPVYTPARHRGKGYGSALTAYVSRRILDSGKKGMLFTDLANPISNSIYQKIGYRPLGDFRHIEFG